MKVFAAELAAGQLPSLRAVKQQCHVGTPPARAILAELAELTDAPQAAAAAIHATTTKGQPAGAVAVLDCRTAQAEFPILHPMPVKYQSGAVVSTARDDRPLRCELTAGMSMRVIPAGQEADARRSETPEGDVVAAVLCCRRYGVNWRSKCRFRTF